MGAWLRQNAAVLAVLVGIAGLLYEASGIVSRMDRLETKVDSLAEIVAANRDAIADIQARLPTLAIIPAPVEGKSLGESGG